MTSKWSQFRPCIDLHNGLVKQIVGGSLTNDEASLKTNFTSLHSSEYYANLYKENGLMGGHLIKLGAGNDEAALKALQAWPDGLQVGGGITDENAEFWLNSGASKVIVTSWLFPDAKFSLDRLIALSNLIGKDRLVVDLSCRTVGESWFVAMNKWQTITNTEINPQNIALISNYCSELLIHAADVEGLCQGIDQKLVKVLREWCTIPCTYAGGGKSIEDLVTINALTNGKVDLTFGSALDIFGGKTVRFEDCVRWNRTGQI